MNKNSLCRVACAAFLALAALPAVSQVNVTVYTGFTRGGDGSPFSNPVGSFTSAQVNFYIGTGFNWHPYGLSTFGAQITGYLDVPTTGTYTFGLYSDDGSSMTLDNQLYIYKGGVGANFLAGAPINMVAGVYNPFVLNFWEDGLGGSGIDLDVQGAGGNFNLVPASWLPAAPEPASLTVLLASGVLLVRRRRAS